MTPITLYRGSTQIIQTPICGFGRQNLDFGVGFYLTTIRSQAEAWAKRNAATYPDKSPILNIFSFDKEGYCAEGVSRIFTDYSKEWLKFIVDSRSGKKPWTGYDYIEGGVANDRVIDTVNLYIAGILDLETALGRLSLNQPNNQVCLLNQRLTDKYLKFIGYERI